MPRIRPYESHYPVPSPRGAPAPIDVGGTGRGLQRIGEGLRRLGTAVEARQQQAETSKLTADSAALDADLTNLWRETIEQADPSDTEVATRFFEEKVVPGLDKLGEDIGTKGAREIYDRMAAEIRNKFLKQTAADQSSLAGVAAVQNHTTAVNALSTGAYRDPSSFDSQITMLGVVTDALVAQGLPRERAIELETQAGTQIARSTVLGTIKLDPKQALNDLYGEKYDAWLDGTQKETLRSHALEMQRSLDADAMRARAQASDDALKNILDLASRGPVALAHVQAQRDTMNAADYRAALAATRTNPLGDDPATIADLQDEVGTAPPGEFMRKATLALEGGRLTPDTFRTMTNQNRSAQETGAAGPGYRQAREYVGGSLNPGEFTADYGGREMRANALSEIDRYARENPDASAEDLLAKAQEIVARYRVIGAEQIPITVGRPYGFTGSVQAVNQEELDAAGARIDEAYRSGRLSDSELIREMDRLVAWKNIIAQQEQRARARATQQQGR